MTRDGILRKAGVVTAAIACLASAVALATPSDAASGSTADVGWVTGVVVDAQGNPVVGDLVSATGPREVPESGIIADESDRRDFTDKNGAFRVRQAEPGYILAICNPEPSYRNTCREPAQGVDHMITYVGPAGITDSWVLQTSLFPSSSNDRNVGTVTVKPQSFVHGTVARAANQSIRLMRLNGTVAWYNSTDEQGRYRFQGLAPGRYRVAGGGDGWLPWQSEVFTVAPGGDAEINGTLDRGATIHGIVRSAGKPVPFLDILVRRSGGGRLVAATTTNENGYFSVSGLRPGSFRVGVSYDGSDYIRHSVNATISGPHGQAAASMSLVKGAVITVNLRADGKPAVRVSDELRDDTGHPILGQRSFDGQVTYPGLASGRYTVVAGNDDHYVTATVNVTRLTTYDLGTKVLSRPTLTLSGTTAPRAVVEATTGNDCPPDGATRPGSFQFIERADAAGHYVMHGLVPGHYMLGSDGWPANYAPYCRSDVPITHDRRAALPLPVGSTVSGRLVYASTGTPVITTLSYELTYPPGSQTNPTDEHPSRAKTRGATGRFLVDRMAAGTVTGALAQGADLDQISSPKFFVIFPFQDGTPYYLTSRARTVEVGAQDDVQLGDIPLILHEGPSS
jgi:hypothetical protein